MATCRCCSDVQSKQAELVNGEVHLVLTAQDGSQTEHVTDHVIAATGYRTDLRRLTFLSAEIRSQMRAVEHAPVLSGDFESSVPGLFFVGMAAANTFGPVLRFVFGAEFTAHRVRSALQRSGGGLKKRYLRPLVEDQAAAITRAGPHI